MYIKIVLCSYKYQDTIIIAIIICKYQNMQLNQSLKYSSNHTQIPTN